MDTDKRKRLDESDASLPEYSTVECMEMTDRIVRPLTSMAVHLDARTSNQKQRLEELLSNLAKIPHEPGPYAGPSPDEALYDKLQ